MNGGNAVPILAAFAFGIAFLILAFTFLPASQEQPRAIHPSPVPFTFVENLPKKIITADEAILVARDDLDKRAQTGGDKAGEYRGGPLGEIKLVYTHPNGTAYRLDKYSGSLAALEPYFDHRPRDAFFWIVILNYEHQPDTLEYYFVINAETKDVIDLIAS